jgi:hypothetical protein
VFSDCGLYVYEEVAVAQYEVQELMITMKNLKSVGLLAYI